jgi:hypothetical protein
MRSSQTKAVASKSTFTTIDIPLDNQDMYVKLTSNDLSDFVGYLPNEFWEEGVQDIDEIEAYFTNHYPDEESSKLLKRAQKYFKAMNYLMQCFHDNV